ncbi:MAG: long-chain fatty acid--CoA ligase [Rhodospirillales bacterium]|nr:long-chain fatty acid--CoA ligase [Rhodospirillales bacterium]
MFFEQMEREGDKPFLWAKENGEYASLSWRETGEKIVALSRALADMGIEKGDRVVLVADNCPEWLIADIAIMAAGGVTVPAYTTNSERDHHHILTNSEAKGVIVSTRKLATPLLPATMQAPDLDFIITVEDTSMSQEIGVPVHLWGDVIEKGRMLEGDVIAAARDIARDETCCIIYTSGTSGAPKGVMLHHGAILCNVMGACDALLELGIRNEVFLSFLPLSHAYEHSAGQFFPIGVGAQIYYAEGVEALSKNLTEVRPTLMTAVPRLYEMMHGRITRDIIKKGGLKARLFEKTVELGCLRYERGGSLPFHLLPQDLLLDRLVRNKIRGRFGGRLKALVSGGAPLTLEVGMFFTALGLRLLQGYGQTEAAPVISVNRPNKAKLHTVGPPMKEVEVKIAEDGEILVRGELVMKGYWRNAEATETTIRDGWLHTGDIGVFDEDGYIQITDRKKDIIVNSGGDNIAPQKIEGLLTLEEEIAQVMVYGDQRPHIVALIVPDQEWASQWAKEHEKPPILADLVDDKGFRRAIDAAIEKVNRNLAQCERIRRYILTGEAFSIENEMLTPTMKVRRHKIKARYGEALKALYRK